MTRKNEKCAELEQGSMQLQGEAGLRKEEGCSPHSFDKIEPVGKCTRGRLYSNRT